MAPPTIIAHKSAFLATQTLHLSQALAPSATWRASNDGAEKAALPPRAVDDAIYRLNHVLAQHARRVYAPQASRYLAEQIEALFYEEAERAVLRADGDDEGEGGGEGGTDVDRQRLRVGADFTTDEAIASLPPTWDQHKPREAQAHPAEARRYAEQTTALASLAARRQELRGRVARLRRMAALLAPFEPSHTNNDDDTTHSATTTTTVQENLVTRNGEVERELERMRLLLARVAGRVAQLPDNNNNNNNRTRTRNASGVLVEDAEECVDLDSLERDKVEKLLDRL